MNKRQLGMPHHLILSHICLTYHHTHQRWALLSRIQTTWIQSLKLGIRNHCQDHGQLLNAPVHPPIRKLHQGAQKPRATTTAPSQIQDTLRSRLDRRDAVIPNLQTLSSNATVSDAVKNLLTSYEGLPQWVASQFTNMYAMSDPILVKQAILQITLVMCDAASLPWAAVKSAWASSMHEVEEGLLTWADSTQWTINRLIASQAALAQPQLSTASSTTKRPCKYSNEASCSHESHHGAYSHICSHCYKQEKQFTYPEHKCNAKQRHSNRTQQNSN